jgi:hypothetical protein
MLGIGCDARIGRNVWLTPEASFVHGVVGNVNLSDGGATFGSGWTQDVIQLGLGVTIHP